MNKLLSKNIADRDILNHLSCSGVLSFAFVFVFAFAFAFAFTFTFAFWASSISKFFSFQVAGSYVPT